jgi:hypothetical protein
MKKIKRHSVVAMTYALFALSSGCGSNSDSIDAIGFSQSLQFCSGVSIGSDGFCSLARFQTTVDVPSPGRYRLRFDAYEEAAGNETSRLQVQILKNAQTIASQILEVSASADAPQTIQVEVDIPSAGGHQVEIRFLNDYWVPNVADRNLLISEAKWQQSASAPSAGGGALDLCGGTANQNGYCEIETGQPRVARFPSGTQGRVRFRAYQQSAGRNDARLQVQLRRDGVLVLDRVDTIGALASAPALVDTGVDLEASHIFELSLAFLNPYRSRSGANRKLFVGQLATDGGAPPKSQGPTVVDVMPNPGGDATGSTPPAPMPSMPNMPAMANMPYVNANAIPRGSGGSNQLLIGPNGQQVRPASDGVGAFRITCDFSHMNFDDAIVFPGQVGASHLHAYFGNTGANALSTPDSIANGGNSTCRGGIANRSAYWVPAVLDGQGNPQAPYEILVYYKSGYNGIEPYRIRKFPRSLRMIAGDARASSPQEHVHWGCTDLYVGNPKAIYACPRDRGIEMTVDFPQCWDGSRLDSSDHKSHMAYTEGGSCPSSHPVAIPAISFVVRYNQPNGIDGWKLSSDMYDVSGGAGYSAHGDWFEGWHEGVADKFIDNCVSTGVDCAANIISPSEALLD